jgi:diacylglycerol O-acyltransferase
MPPPDVLGNEMLAPGVRRLRPDDHFMVLVETQATPMHVGALVVLDVPDEAKQHLVASVRRQLAERIWHTPLSAVLRQSPDGYDSDLWVDVDRIDFDRHVTRVPVEGAMGDDAVRAFVANRVMERLDLSLPPFHVDVFDRLEGSRGALYFRMHHAVADGVGFQTILGLLNDGSAPTPPRGAGRLPQDAEWRFLAGARFDRLAAGAAAQVEHRKAALAAIEELSADPANRRASTPALKMSGPTSGLRAYGVVSLELERLKAVGKRLGGTVNDVFLAIAAAAMRRLLIEMDDLPDTSIVVNSARSYRRPEHGLFGNRIVAMHPHLATTEPDPIVRFKSIQAAMAAERRRTPYDEALLDQPERPFGARNRRAKFAQRLTGGAAVLPGNVTLSNVPGPAAEQSFAGFRQIANYPVPLLGSGRFLNVTSRRNGPMLDMGIMADPLKIPDPGRVARYLSDALAEYERLGGLA